MRRASTLIAIVALATAGFTGCGGSDAPDEANGKKLFISSCGGCHTMADAGTKGDLKVGGPNMDDAFRGARQQGFESSSFEGVVKKWIEQPEQISQPIMPANIVTGDDARDVAAYVAKVAGTSKESAARPPEPIE